MTAGENLDTATELITSTIDTQEERAEKSIDDARGFLEVLKNTMLFPPQTLEDLTPVIVDLNTIPVGAIPPPKPITAINNIKASIPTAPGEFEATVTDRAIQSAPQETFSTPVINFPTAPTFTKETKPSSPNIALPSKVPDTPSLVVPSDLTVSTTNVPNIPAISLPNWGENIPTLNIDLPSTILAYVEPVYTSALKTLIASDLLTKVTNGGTGLNATIEGNIWNRDVERLAQVLVDNIDDTINRFAGRGFTLPPGIVAAEVQELQINHTNDRSQASRDVAIEQAKIADANTKAFLQLGLSLEELEINHANNIANRALDAEKSVVEFSIALFNSKVSKFNTELARYQAKAVEIQGNIQIQNLILDQYKAELAGVEAEATKDKVSIENYKAKLAAHDAVIKLYEAEVSAVVAAMNIERAKVEIFKSEIDAYIANIQAQRNEYDLFLAQIQGEKAKVDLHVSEVDAYVSRVNAVKISNDVVIAKINSDIAVEELNLRAHLANVDIWKEKSQLAIQELGIERDFYSEELKEYSEVVKMAVANAELSLQSAVKAGQFEQAQKELELQKSIADMNALIEEAKVRLAGAGVVSSGYIALATVASGIVQSLIQLSSEGVSTIAE